MIYGSPPNKPLVKTISAKKFCRNFRDEATKWARILGLFMCFYAPHPMFQMLADWCLKFPAIERRVIPPINYRCQDQTTMQSTPSQSSSFPDRMRAHLSPLSLQQHTTIYRRHFDVAVNILHCMVMGTPAQIGSIICTKVCKTPVSAR